MKDLREVTLEELQELVKPYTPLTLQVPPSGWTHPNAELYEQVVDACRRYGIPEVNYLPLKPGVELQRVFHTEIRIAVPFDPENDPGAKQWLVEVDRAAAVAAREKQKELLASTANFERVPPHVNKGRPIVRPRRSQRKREIPVSQRGDIFVLRHFLCMSTKEIKERLNLPPSVHRQAIESTAEEIRKQLGATQRPKNTKRKLTRRAR